MSKRIERIMFVIAMLILVILTLRACPAGAQLDRFMGGQGAVGNGAPPQQAVVGPYHVDFTDRLCVSDYSNYEARCVVMGTVQRLAGFSGRPVGIARDPADNRVYVSTFKSTAPVVPAGLWVVEPSGGVRALPIGTTTAPYGLALFGGFLWWTDQQGNGFWRLPTPCLTGCTPQVMIPPGTLLNPQDVDCRLGLGCLIADTSHHRVVLFDLASNVSTVAGIGTMGFSGDGGSALAAQLAFPSGLAITATGQVIIADSVNNRVRRFIIGGTIQTVAGNGQQNTAKLLPAANQNPLTFPITNPQGVATDGSTVFVGSNFVGAIYDFPLGGGPVTTVTATRTLAATPTNTMVATATATALRTCNVPCD